MQIEQWDHGYPFVKMLKSCPARGPRLANVEEKYTAKIARRLAPIAKNTNGFV